MAGLVERVQRPPVQRLPLPLGEPGVRGPQPGAGAGRPMPRSTRIDAMITPAWHTATTVRPRTRCASRSSILLHPLVEAVPASPALARTPGRARPPCRTTRSGRPYSVQVRPSASPVWTSQRSHSWPKVSSPRPGAMIDAVSMARGRTLASSTSARTRPDRRGGLAGLRPVHGHAAVSPVQPVCPPTPRGSRREHHRGGRGSGARHHARGSPWLIGLPNAQAQRITSRWSPAPRLLEEGHGSRTPPRYSAERVCGDRGLHQRPAGGVPRRCASSPCRNSDYLSDPDDLVRADAVIESLDDLSEAVVDPALR